STASGRGEMAAPGAQPLTARRNMSRVQANYSADSLGKIALQSTLITIECLLLSPLQRPCYGQVVAARQRRTRCAPKPMQKCRQGTPCRGLATQHKNQC